MPYFVVSDVGGVPNYVFTSGSVNDHHFQIAQYYREEGRRGMAYADNKKIVALLDRHKITSTGIMCRRLTLPRLDVLDGKVLRMTQDWVWETTVP